MLAVFTKFVNKVLTEITAKKRGAYLNQVVDVISIFFMLIIVQFPILLISNLLKKEKLFANMNYIAISAYVVVIIRLTLWPPIIGQSAITWSEISYNLLPFDSILGSLNHSYYMIGIRNVLGNIVLLMPIAILYNFKSWKRVIIVGFCISMSIEILQVIMTKYGLTFRRTFDVDDLMLNTIGILIGYVINIGIRVISKRIRALIVFQSRQ